MSAEIRRLWRTLHGPCRSIRNLSRITGMTPYQVAIIVGGVYCGRRGPGRRGPSKLPENAELVNYRDKEVDASDYAGIRAAAQRALERKLAAKRALRLSSP